MPGPITRRHRYGDWIPVFMEELLVNSHSRFRETVHSGKQHPAPCFVADLG